MANGVLTTERQRYSSTQGKRHVITLCEIMLDRTSTSYKRTGTTGTTICDLKIAIPMDAVRVFTALFSLPCLDYRT